MSYLSAESICVHQRFHAWDIQIVPVLWFCHISARRWHCSLTFLHTGFSIWMIDKTSHLHIHSFVVFLCLLQKLFETSRWHIFSDKNHLCATKWKKTWMSEFRVKFTEAFISTRCVLHLTLALLSVKSNQYLWNFTMFGCSTCIRFSNIPFIRSCINTKYIHSWFHISSVVSVAVPSF